MKITFEILKRIPGVITILIIAQRKKSSIVMKTLSQINMDLIYN